MPTSERRYDRKRPALTNPPVNWYPDPGYPVYQRAIVWEPGFAMDPDEGSRPPSQRYGRSAMSLRWLLRGPKGVAQFWMSTGWTPERVLRGRYAEWMHREPSGYDLGYHALVPQWEGQEPMGVECQYLGGPCYYDGTSLGAEPVLEALFDVGEDGVWAALGDQHDSLVGPV